jgi:hypothetical protein
VGAASVAQTDITQKIQRRNHNEQCFIRECFGHAAYYEVAWFTHARSTSISTVVFVSHGEHEKEISFRAVVTW